MDCAVGVLLDRLSHATTCETLAISNLTFCLNNGNQHFQNISKRLLRYRVLKNVEEA